MKKVLSLMLLLAVSISIIGCRSYPSVNEEYLNWKYDAKSLISDFEVLMFENNSNIISPLMDNLRLGDYPDLAKLDYDTKLIRAQLNAITKRAEEFKAKYQKKFPGATDAVFLLDVCMELFITAMATKLIIGEAPDVFEHWYYDESSRIRGVIYDLSDMIEQLDLQYNVK